MNQIVISLNVIFDVLVLHFIKHYVDEYCTNIQLLQGILFFLAQFYIKIKCSMILLPYRLCTMFSYFSNIIQSRYQISFTLNLIIRVILFMGLITQPYLFFIIDKIITLMNYVGMIIFIYVLVQVCWIPGKYFQYNLNHAIIFCIPILLIYLYNFMQASIIMKISSLLLPIIQVILSDKGSLITSLLLATQMLEKSFIGTLIIQLIVLGFVIYRNKQYELIFLGFMISCAEDLPNNLITNIIYFVIYGVSVFQDYKKNTNVEYITKIQ